MKRILLLSVFLITILPASVIEIYACKCAMESSKLPLEQQVIHSLKESKAVFTGKVTAIEKLTILSVKVTMKVDRVWKKDLPETVILFTGVGKGDCGYPFKEGESYLIYEDSSSNSLVVNICSRTKLLSKADEELKILGNGKTPTALFPSLKSSTI
jgi:hypothetical protein